MNGGIVVVMFVCLLIAPAFFVSGETINVDKEYIINEKISASGFSGSHTVLVEYFSSSTSSKGFATSNQLYDMYSSGDYDFQYVTLVTDKSKAAENRSQEFGVRDYPIVYFDGGHQILSGEQSSIIPYVNALAESNSREINDVDLQLEAYWTQCPCHKDIVGDVRVINNKDDEYNGRLVISVVEINSRWEDQNGRPYDYAILDYIMDAKITIEKAPLGKYATDYFWYTAGAGFPRLDRSAAANLLVVASIFSDSTGFADKTAVSRLFKDEPPAKPSKPNGESNGKPGDTYTYKTRSTDPEGDEIQYGWDWDGDYKVDEWTGFYPSGQEVSTSHTWDSKGNYNIRVRARDKLEIESFWSDPLSVSMPLNKISRHSLLSNFVLRFLSKYTSFTDVLNDKHIFKALLY